MGTISAQPTLKQRPAIDLFALNRALSLRQTERLAGPTCQATNEGGITVSCKYAALPRDTSAVQGVQGGQRIVLDRFAVSFDGKDEGEMNVSLTFTNDNTAAISETRAVYLAIDDNQGRNYIRRALRHVDLRKIAPGTSLTFSDGFLVGALAPGRYIFHLWIPSLEPALKYASKYNLLLASKGVPDPASGLNVLAEYRIGQ
jgi:hypothetical protein